MRVIDWMLTGLSADEKKFDKSKETANVSISMSDKDAYTTIQIFILI